MGGIIVHVAPSELRGARFLLVHGPTEKELGRVSHLGPAYWSEPHGCWVVPIAGLSMQRRGWLAGETYRLARAGMSFELER